MLSLIPFLLLAQDIAAKPLVQGDPQPPAAAKPADPALALIGKSAPDFTLPDQNDKLVALKEARKAKKWVVVAFYPADMTAGCTLQNKSYTAGKDKFAPLNALVYTVSTQDTKSKQKFCERDALTNTLLSDVGGKIAAAYGVLNNERGVARRVTFYINPKGKIVAVDTKINVKNAAEDTMAMLQKLQEGKN
jgi:thioredoxin-dependent peroxiredoxin